MWILPKNLPIFPYAQDMEVLILDLEELSELCAQSLMWRSKPSQSSTWLKRLKQASWIQPLSTQTLKPFHGESIVTKWTSSLEASLVSHLARPDEEPEMKTQGIFGHISSEESESWEDLPLFSLRTLKESSQANLKGTVGEIPKGHLFCSMSSGSWKGWDTAQRREYSQRLKSERHTNGKESLFLVSEMISDRAVLNTSMQCSEMELRQPIQKEGEQISTLGSRQGSQWATPMARDHKGPNRRAPNQVQVFGASLPMQIETEVIAWTTPIARDSLEIEMNHQIPIRKDGKHRLDTMPRQVHHQEGYKGKLNPRWVETLMGLPIGWTMPSCQSPVTIELMSSGCLEMELSQTPPQELLESCSID